MAELSKVAFETKYNDGTSGLYKAGQIDAIGSDDHRSLVTDIKDSVVWPEDDIETSVDVPIASIAVLDSNSTPVDLIAAPGVGSGLVPISIGVRMDYNSAPYATNTTFAIRYGNGIEIVVDPTFFLASTGDRIIELQCTVVDVVLNQSLQFYTQGGDPTGGDSNITVTIKYKTVTI